MSDGNDFFSLVQDGVSIWRALGAKMTNLVVVAVAVVKSKATYYHDDECHIDSLAALL